MLKEKQNAPVLRTPGRHLREVEVKNFINTIIIPYTSPKVKEVVLCYV